MDVFDTYYYDQDHLGNVRQVTDKSGKAVQTTDYYPFGMQLCDGTTSNFDQNHKYNGQGSCQRVQTSSLSMPSASEAQPKVKEFDTMHGLNTYDYGARQYNPVTARWDRMDPLCEKYYLVSPYAYCINNPVMLVDLHGEEPLKKYVGTMYDFAQLLNNSPRQVGKFRGQFAADYMLSLSNTEWKWSQWRPIPTQTPYFNKKKGRYIYTKKGGWLDMAHFMFYAGKAYNYKIQKEQARAILNSFNPGCLEKEDRVLLEK